MRQKTNGFTNFMKKLEGKNDDNILQAEGLGFRVHQGYECLLEFLQSRICLSTYVERIHQCSYEERHDAYNLRKRIGLDFPSNTLGVYVTDRSYYFKAVEYLREHQTSEQQAGVQGTADARGSDPYPVHVNVRMVWVDDYPSSSSSE